MIYLASPYSHSDDAVQERRYDLALHASAILLKQGYYVFSPIVHSRVIAVKHYLPHDHAFWQGWNGSLLKASNSLWVLCIDGWKDSRGVAWEIDRANEWGKKISYVSYPGCSVFGKPFMVSSS